MNFDPLLRSGKGDCKQVKNKIMITHLFYLTGLLFIWSEIKWIISPQEQVEFRKRFDVLSKENKGKKWDGFSEEYKEVLKSCWGLIVIFLWMFIGIFTVQ